MSQIGIEEGDDLLLDDFDFGLGLEDSDFLAPEALQEETTPCEVADCERIGTACFYPDNETGEPNHWYCTVHAKPHGFCWGCGQFWGGVESFDFARHRGGIQGLCENCSDAAKDEFGLNEEEDDEAAYDY